jgi:ankyrin repeat protein
MLAAESGQITLCAKLLAKGGDVRLKDSRDATVLHYAVRNGSLELVRILLEKGTDPNVIGRFAAPLKIAQDTRRSDIAHLLLQFGAR